jgi:DNA-binding NarL/FixJ family response regulator
MEQRSAAVILDSQELFGAGLKCLLLRDRARLRSYFATSFESVLALLEADPCIRLAVLDVDAAGMAGAASVDLLRRRFPGLALVVTTARGTRAEILACLGWAVHGVVVKSQPAREIAGAIRVVMAGGIFVPPILCETERHQGAECDVLPFRSEAGSDNENRVPEVPELDAPTGAHLSVRQAAVFRLLVRGLSNKEIARELALAEGTVKVHLAALYRALRVRNRAGAVASLTEQSVRRIWNSAAAPVLMLSAMIA